MASSDPSATARGEALERTVRRTAALFVALLALGGLRARAEEHQPLAMCDFPALPTGGKRTEAEERCRRGLARRVQQCDALLDFESEVLPTELATLRHYCHVSWNCQQQSPAQPESGGGEKPCIEAGLRALEWPPSIAAPSTSSAAPATDLEEVKRVANRVLGPIAKSGGHRAVMLTDALGALSPSWSPVPVVSKTLRLLAESVSAGKPPTECGALAGALSTYVERNRRGQPPEEAPLRRELLLEREGNAACATKLLGGRSEEAKAFANALGDLELVTLAISLDAELTVVVDAIQPGRLSPAATHELRLAGQRLVLLAVPRFSTISVRSRPGEAADTIPAVYSRVAAQSLEWWQPQTSCSIIEIDTDAANGQGAGSTSARPTLLVAGVPIDLVNLDDRPDGDRARQHKTTIYRASIKLPKGRYPMSIVYAYGGRLQRESQSLDVRDLEPWSGCRTHRVSLSKAATVALIPIDNLGSDCPKAGIDRVVLRSMARDSLCKVADEAGRKFRDYETWGRALQWFEDRRGALGSTDGEQKRTDAGTAEQDRFLHYRNELLRQGVGEAVNVELTCIPLGRGRGYRYALRATKVNIDDATRRRAGADGRRPLDDIVTDDGASTSDRDQLPVAITNTLRRLFGLNYLAEARGKQSFGYGEPVSLRVRSYLPESPPASEGTAATGPGRSAKPSWLLRLKTRRLSERFQSCLASQEDLATAWQDSVEDSISKSVSVSAGPELTSREFTFVPAEEGRYVARMWLESPSGAATGTAAREPHDSEARGVSLLGVLERLVPRFLKRLFVDEPAIRTEREDDDRAAYFACFEVKRAPPTLWVGLLGGLVPRASKDSAPSKDSALPELMAGARFSIKNQLSWGVGGGFRVRTFSADAAPSWDNHLGLSSDELPDYGQDGGLRVDWYRYGFPVAVFLEFPFVSAVPYLLVRPSAVLDPSIIDTSAVPAGLHAFLQSRDPSQGRFDVDIGLRLELELRHPGVGAGLVFGVEYLALDDAFWALNDAGKRATIVYDTSWALLWGIRWTR